METVRIAVTDTNGCAKGLHTMGIERGTTGDVVMVEYAGLFYVYSRKGVHRSTGKAMTEFAANGDALRLWVADDLSFAEED
jgi:hypothetical protein